MQKISPFLWFNDNAEEAVNFYVSVFKNSKILETQHYTEASAGPANRPVGSVLTISFQLEGQDFTALNGGPVFKFTPAISLLVNCETQAEIDELWAKLSAVPEAEQCGWLQDKFGVSWQIVPAKMNELLFDADTEKAERAMAAMMKMKKLDLGELQKAHAGN